MKRILFLIIICLRPDIVFAHIDVGSNGFTSGLLHPVLGFDHLLAMVSVGIVSAQIGGRSIWVIPLIFVLAMLAGGLTGIWGIPIPYFSIEQGIAASVFILGLVITADNKISSLVVSVFVTFFGVFHGHAHGLEMPDGALPALYILGFVCGTASLHILGVVIGFFSKKNKTTEVILRVLGLGIAIVGLKILFFR